MINPFLHSAGDERKSDYLTSDCSLNRLRIAKLPIYGVEDEIEGLTVKQIFSTELVINEIQKNAAALGIDTEKEKAKSLPKALVRVLNGEDEEKSKLALKIIEKFGNRLGIIFLTLKKGDKANRAAREDWTDAHWDYWASVEEIALVGGLASGSFGEILKRQVNYIFSLQNIVPYKIKLYDNSSDLGVLGCATQISDADGVNIVMDFGQTNIKRSYVTKANEEITEIKTLEPYPSKYMDWEIADEEEKLRQAKRLHSYLIKAVKDTYTQAKSETNREPNKEIVISIASYTVDGKLNSERGGYAKLCALGKNYAECLWWELSGTLRKDVVIKLIHDGTAIALNFSGRKNMVCLSLGSYLGVGFPETRFGWF